MGRKDNKAKARRAARRAQALKANPPADAPIIDQDGSDGGPVRPTPAQQRQGAYRLPSGKGHATAPALNLKADCIAALMIPPARLTPDQHDAALDWREMRRALILELGVSTGRSCLDIGPVGHDETDGDAALADRWQRARLALGPLRVRVLDRTCVDGAWPQDLDVLHEALDRFAAFATRRLTGLRKTG